MGNPSLKEIVAARDECARIISMYGESYLPIFERLEKEITLHQKRNRLLDKALKIGTQSGTQNGTQLKVRFLKASK
ncbi:hypothetical protein [Marinoscillum sp.]|uniref:hypothetical protein n=1 Tax=Marinoscillum sp. TaxID=2024838 RepID=UPI003BA869D2